MNLICIYCEEPIFDAANIVFGEPMHLDCECSFIREIGEAAGEWTAEDLANPFVDNAATV